jgi:hypothetical protein
MRVRPYGLHEGHRIGLSAVQANVLYDLQCASAVAAVADEMALAANGVGLHVLSAIMAGSVPVRLEVGQLRTADHASGPVRFGALSRFLSRLLCGRETTARFFDDCYGDDVTDRGGDALQMIIFLHAPTFKLSLH